MNDIQEDLRTIKYTLNRIDTIKYLMIKMNKNFEEDKYWMDNNSVYDLINRFVYMQAIAIDIGREAMLLKANSKLSLRENE